MVQVVQPGEWPGVISAVSVTSPTRDLVALADHAVDLDGRKVERGVALLSRVVAALEQRLVGGARGELRAGVLLQPGEPAGVVEMRMRVEQLLDVGDLEAELLDVRLDLRVRLGQAGVDENMTLRRGDQERREARGADVVDVADDAERLGRFVPRDLQLVEQVAQGLRLRRRCQ